MLTPAHSLRPLISRPGQWALPAYVIAGRRVGGYKYISIQQTPSTSQTQIEVKSPSQTATSPDATFEVLGTPHSLLSVTLQPSQPLHTRRGTLLALAGDPSNTVSALQSLSPIRRALVGIPFLYNRITSTTPSSLLIAPSSLSTTLCILQLDGTQDWLVTERSALLAWTGTSLNIQPKLPTSLASQHWGSTALTGRGLLCLAGTGHTYSIELGSDESYIVHPNNILAYTTSGTSQTQQTPLPTPFRFASRQPRFQIPLALGDWFPDTRLVKMIKATSTYKFFTSLSLRIKLWTRKNILGDRLHLRFQGPTTILVQSRARSIRDTFTSDQVNEIADAEAGTVMQTVRRARMTQDEPRSRQVLTTSLPTTPAHSTMQDRSQATPSTGSNPLTGAARNAGPRSLSQKSDSERMGVQGAQVSAQTSAKAETTAPQVVTAERSPVDTRSPGAKELERMSTGNVEKSSLAKESNKNLKASDHAV